MRPTKTSHSTFHRVSDCFSAEKAFKQPYSVPDSPPDLRQCRHLPVPYSTSKGTYPGCPACRRHLHPEPCAERDPAVYHSRHLPEQYCTYRGTGHQYPHGRWHLHHPCNMQAWCALRQHLSCCPGTHEVFSYHHFCRLPHKHLQRHCRFRGKASRSTGSAAARATCPTGVKVISRFMMLLSSKPIAFSPAAPT